MKKKLIGGMGIITLIFVLCGIFIFANLRLIAYDEGMRDSQDRVLDSYDKIMLHVRSAQAELYRHKAGYSRDIEGIAENVLKIEDALSAIRRGYESLNVARCNKCHLLGPKLAALRKRLDQASEHLRNYEEKASLIVTTGDIGLERSWENEASQEGKRLMDIIAGASEATARMNEHLDSLQMSSLKRSGFSIIAAILLSALLSLTVIVFLIRSIRRPLNKLVEGIEKVSSGNYHSRVDVASDDEIGFLAKTFNSMTESLEKSTRQRDLLDEELRQLNDNLEKKVMEATEELKSTHEQMLRAETLSAVGRLASGVAHELATPLSSVINYVQMIRQRAGEEDRLSGDMTIIEKELVRCRDLLRGMLAFVRPPEKGKMPTDINGILHDLVELIRYRAKSSKVTVRESLAPSLPSALAVPGQLKQVFMNIMVNALESMPGGGEMEVATSLEDQGRAVSVRISDTGSGISESHMNRIFEPFFTNKESGTGLGLSISYGIIKGHGGDIEVESEEGRGTTFVVSLPVSVVGVAEETGEQGKE